MMQFFSTDDTSFYSQVITDWHLSKDAYARNAGASDIEKVLADGYMTLIGANLLMYDQYFKTHHRRIT